MNRLNYSGLSAFCLFILAFVFSACSEKERIQSKSTYTFTNSLNADVTLHIYDNQNDYYQSSNVLKTLTIPRGGSIPVVFDAIRSYWVDWYTGDYMFNNWATSSDGTASLVASPSPKLNIAAENVGIEISSRSSDISRSVLLNGNELSSSWRMDVDNIPALNGTHTFTFRRDYTGQYTFTPQSGNTIVKPVKFLLYQVTGYTFRLYVTDDSQVQLADLLFNPNQGSNPNPGRDTMMVMMRNPNSGSYIPARRQ